MKKLILLIILFIIGCNESTSFKKIYLPPSDTCIYCENYFLESFCLTTKKIELIDGLTRSTLENLFKDKKPFTLLIKKYYDDNTINNYTIKTSEISFIDLMKNICCNSHTKFYLNGVKEFSYILEHEIGLSPVQQDSNRNLGLSYQQYPVLTF